MMIRRWILNLAVALCAGAAGYTTLHADIHATLTDKDKADIKALLAAYGPALIGCKPEAWADLFATPGGYFASGPRGELRERVQFMEMVLSYDRCDGPRLPRARRRATSRRPSRVERGQTRTSNPRRSVQSPSSATAAGRATTRTST